MSANPQPRPRDVGRRIAIAGGLGGLALAGLGVRLADLQLRQGARYRQAALENGIRLDPEPGRRGTVYDRAGTVLAGTRRDFSVTLIPEAAPDADAVLARLARWIDLSPERRERVRVEIEAVPAFLEVPVAGGLSWEEFARVGARASELPGIVTRIGGVRSYPLGAALAHPLGYVARPDPNDIEKASAGAPRLRRLMRHPHMRIGRAGLEAAAESWLAGKPGYRRVVVNASGRVAGELDSHDVAPGPGRPIVLAIDAAIQKQAMAVMGDRAGAIVVMDIESGDILACCSRPGYDPEAFAGGIAASEYGRLRADPRKPLFDRTRDGTYPPGSVFKPIVAAAALEAGILHPSVEFLCLGSVRLGNRRFHCWEEGGHGRLDLHGAMVRSCDVFFYELAMMTGPDRIAAMARRFGLGQAYDLGLAAGARGLVPDEAWKRRALREPWMLGETLHFGIGQGYLGVTPVELAVMAARLGRPEIDAPPRLLLSGPPVSTNRLPPVGLSRDTADRLHRALAEAVSPPHGTAWRSGWLGFKGLRLAGKTGTAQVRSISREEREQGVREDGEIARHLRDHALFVAYAPHDAPRYACSVIVEHGGSGSKSAAPIAKRVLAETLRRDPMRRPAFVPPEAGS